MSQHLCIGVQPIQVFPAGGAHSCCGPVAQVYLLALNVRARGGCCLIELGDSSLQTPSDKGCFPKEKNLTCIQGGVLWGEAPHCIPGQVGLPCGQGRVEGGPLGKGCHCGRNPLNIPGHIQVLVGSVCTTSP